MAKKDTGIVSIHGKQYKTVALRVEEFRNDCSIQDGWGIETQLYHFDDHHIIMRAIVTDPEGRVIGTGYGEEVRGSSNINKTSAIENGETSAIGRALAACGYAGSEFASADELTNKLGRQAAMASSSTHKPSGPSQKQKDYAWNLIKKLPEAERPGWVDKMKTATAASASTVIEQLKEST